MLAAIANCRTSDGRCLLPGALMLLAFHVLVIGSGAIGRVQPIGQLVFALSVASVTLSSVLLMALTGGIHLPERAREIGLLAAVPLFATGMGALTLGLAGDFFVVATQLSRSTISSDFLAGVVLLLVYAPWL
jgi:hypothetical protein